jgi:putative N6-adenine-specific DNA methylase
MTFNLIATCPEETKHILVEELKELGVEDIQEDYKAVHFRATEEQFYKLHLTLRTASRIRLVLKEFRAKTSEEIYGNAREIPWDEIFTSEQSFIVDGMQTDRGEQYMSGNQISKSIRLAIESVFEKKGERIPKVDLKEPKVRVVGYLREGRCMISLDTTGKALHKRGYKFDTHPAPLKETLASAVLKMVGYDGTQNFLDPMCGSGTIVIEAAYIAMGKAANIHRKKDEFGFEWLKMLNRPMWKQIQDEVRGDRELDPPHLLHASDINSEFVKMARANALRARVEKHIQFQTLPFEELVKPAETGIMICNLPYGERLDEVKANELKEFYQSIGDKLKQEFKGWTAALIASESSPYKFIGLKPKWKRPILNGMIPCKLLYFEMYDGSRKFKNQ